MTIINKKLERKSYKHFREYLLCSSKYLYCNKTIDSEVSTVVQVKVFSVMQASPMSTEFRGKQKNST